MANDLVVKSNTLINASYSLTLAEQRLIGLAIVKANNQHKEFPLNSSRKLFSTQTFSSNYISCFKSDLMNKIIFSFSTLKTKFFNDLVF